MAFAAYGIRTENVTLDRAFLAWIKRICADHKGANDVTGVRDAVETLLALTDEDMARTVTAWNATKNPNKRTSFKHYYTPVLTVKIAQLGSLAHQTQIILLDIDAQLAIFNEEVDHTMRFFYMTFEATGDNHGLAIANYNEGSKNIGQIAAVIANRISELPGLALS
jgi:hypothetical protein